MRLFTLASITCLFIALLSFDAYSNNSNGAQLYKKCSSCHGANASGKGLNKLSQDSFIKRVKEIKNDSSPKMKRMRDIFITYSEKDINDLAAYFETIKKK